MSSKSGRRPWTRWGFLILILAMGLSLLAVGTMSLVFVQGAAEQVLRARAVDLHQAARRSMVLNAGSGDSPLLEGVLDDLREQGVSSIALLDARGQITRRAGTNEELVWDGRLPAPGEPRLREVDEGRRVQVLGRLMGRRGRMRGAGWRHAHRRWGAHWMLLEYEPRLSQSLKDQAGLSFALGLGAALVLWLAAFLLWRLYARSDAYARQLQEKRRLASLGEMSAVLGHEIRNPLASLKGHAQLLLEKIEEGHPAHKNARQVVEESLRLETLTREILDFVRSGRLQREPGDLPGLLRDLVRDLDGAELHLDLPESLPAWPMDAERMRRALANIVGNALQASPPGEPVDLSLRQEGPGLLIQVRDRGPGLEAGREEAIFDPFVTGRVQGTGLGLAIARSIIEGHGGTIRAENHPGGGALFSIGLPVGVEEAT